MDCWTYRHTEKFTIPHYSTDSPLSPLVFSFSRFSFEYYVRKFWTLLPFFLFLIGLTENNSYLFSNTPKPCDLNYFRFLCPRLRYQQDSLWDHFHRFKFSASTNSDIILSPDSFTFFSYTDIFLKSIPPIIMI